MKKVSAFSVFKTKKDRSDADKGDTDTNGTTSIRRAASVPTIKDDVKKALGDARGKKILKVLKGGSLRTSLRGTPKSRPRLLKADNEIIAGSGGTSVKLTSVTRSNTDLSTIQEQDKGKHLETPKVPMQVSAVKPRRHVNSSDLPPTGKTSPGKIKETSSTKDSSLNGSVNGKGSPKSQPARNSKTSLKSSTSQHMKNDNDKTEDLLPKQQKKANMSGQKSASPKDANNKIRNSKTKSPNQEGGRQGGKRHINASQNVPNKKKKVETDGSKVQTQDCSTEEIEQAMSFEEETEIQANTLPYMYNSTEEAEKIFECLIHPVKPDKFFKDLWEKKPLLVKRHMKQYNDGWFSTAELDRILREENIQYGTNLDVTTYTNGVRETHNPTGRAYAPVVWDFYQNGCSVRLLNPQTYSRNVWKVLSTLQEYFGCFAGANVYLTPAGSQGFAPHYDDIEAFILQLEGRKYWRLYKPRNDAENLPRTSSENFDEAEVGKPILDVVLDPGDLLYFPRGTIHQANTLDTEHSLHITVSCYQKNTWGDLFEKMIPRALQIAMEEDVEFRYGLPREYSTYMGIANTDLEQSQQRKSFLKKVEQLMMKMMNHLPVDSACDQMMKKFIHDSLPPVLSDAEKSCSVHGAGERWDKAKSCVVDRVEIEPDTYIKIIRKGVLRLITEEDEVRIYHSLENTRLYHEVEPQYIEISAEAAPAVEYLILQYPKYVSVDSLPLLNIDQKIDIATSLYENGLILTGEPLDPIDDENSSCD